MMFEKIELSWQIEAWKSSSFGHSLILIDMAGRVLWTNDNDDHVSNGSDHMQAITTDGEIPQQWQAAILATAAQANCDGPRIVMLEKPDKSEHFLAKFTCFDVPTGRVLGLAVPRPVALSQPLRDDLARATKMSPTEIKVLVLTLNGNTINQISARLVITIETARTHMRRIYSKLGVNSREALFSAITVLL
jgi:DNA-binding CsgD family transcriptional regulator